MRMTAEHAKGGRTEVEDKPFWRHGLLGFDQVINTMERVVFLTLRTSPWLHIASRGD